MAEWWARLTAMWEFFWSNPASYLCWNLHVGKWLTAKRWAGVAPEVNLSANIYHVCFCQVQLRLPTLVLKPREDINGSPKQGYYWSHKKDLCPQNFQGGQIPAKTRNSLCFSLCKNHNSLFSLCRDHHEFIKKKKKKETIFALRFRIFIQHTRTLTIVLLTTTQPHPTICRRIDSQ